MCSNVFVMDECDSYFCIGILIFLFIQKGEGGSVCGCFLMYVRHATFLGWQSVFLTYNSIRIGINPYH